MFFRVAAQNFRSYLHLAYTVDRPGLVAVEGYWEGSEDRSNGAGKSSFLPDLLSWAIYGCCVDGQKQVCRRGTERCSVRLELPFVSFTRSQGPDGRQNKLAIDGLDHRRLADAEDYLLGLFPPQRIFVSTLILGQGVGERFSAWKPAERTNLLAELFTLSIWEQAHAAVLADLRVLDTRVLQLGTVAGTLENELTALAGAGRSEDGLNALRTRTIEAETQITELANDYNRQRGGLDGLMRKRGAQFGQLSAENVRLVNLLQQIKEAGRENCPTCGRSFPARQRKQRLTELHTHQEQISERRDALSGQVAELDVRITEIQRVLQTGAADLVAARLHAQGLRTELARAQLVAERSAEIQQKLAQTHTELAEAQAENTVLKMLGTAFAPGGIPLRKIESVLVVANRMLVDICSEVWEREFLVQLSAERTLQKGGARPEINLTVTNEAGSYSASSPGQRRAIDLSVQLALRRLLLAAWRSAPPILVCDDVVDVLDQYAKQRLYRNVLLPEAERAAVFVLSPDVQHPVSPETTVRIGYIPGRGSIVESCVSVGRQPALRIADA